MCLPQEGIQCVLVLVVMILLQVQDILLPFLNPAAATEAAAAKLHRAATISHLSTPEDKESKLRHVSDSSIVSVCV